MLSGETLYEPGALSPFDYWFEGNCASLSMAIPLVTVPKIRAFGGTRFHILGLVFGVAVGLRGLQ